MSGLKKTSAQQLSQIFGFSTFHGTPKMKIGNILEIKILQAYCKQRKLILKKERGGRTLTMLYQYNYVGHTPDGKTCKSKDDEAEVLEGKVVFNMQDTLESLVKNTRTNFNWVCSYTDATRVVFSCIVVSLI